MDPCRVQMTATPFVGATAEDAVSSSGSADMESSRGIEVASFPTSGRPTEAACIRILWLHMVSIRAVITALAVVSRTTEDACRVIHLYFFLRKEKSPPLFFVSF